MEVREIVKPPKHYDLYPEPIEVIHSWDMNFNLGNVIKYVSRAGKKDGESKIKDLRKAIDYLNFEIAYEEEVA